jgi:hypothetical protein
MVNHAPNKDTNNSQNTFEVVMNESMINVINEPQAASKTSVTPILSNPSAINVPKVVSHLSPPARNDWRESFIQHTIPKPGTMSEMQRGQRIHIQ